MRLEDHILEKPAKNCKQYALKILETYVSVNPNVLNEVRIKNKSEVSDNYFF